MRTIIEWIDFEKEKPPEPLDGIYDEYKILCQSDDRIYMTFEAWDGVEWLIDVLPDKVLGWSRNEEGIKHEL